MQKGIPKPYHIAGNTKDDVGYLIWTRVNWRRSDKIKFDANIGRSLNYTHFNPKLPTKILIHGYKDHGETGWVISVKNRYLKKGNYKMQQLNLTT